MTNAELIALLQTKDPSARAEIVMVCEPAQTADAVLVEHIDQAFIDKQEDFLKEDLQEHLGNAMVLWGDR